MKMLNTFMEKIALRGVIVASLFCLMATAAKATIITFSGGSGDFTSPYTESGFTITPLSSGTYSGSLQFNGSGIYVYAGGAPFSYNTYAEIEIQLTQGGLFSFNGVNILPESSEEFSYILTGQLNGATVASSTGGFFNGNSGQSYNFNYNSSVEIDTLFISVGMEPDIERNWSLTDINVTPQVAVPDHASTAGLLVLSLIPLVGLGIRQSRSSASV